MQPNFVDKTIWTGDNLDILRGLNSDCVDLIYLDPPFNSNRTYSAPVGGAAAEAAFKDTWTLSDLDVAWMGLIADEQPSIYKVIETAGFTHGKGMQSYLCMMAVRLLEMRRVLKDTGSIYLHCDDTALHYLKLLMDAVFGNDGFRNNIAWKRTYAHNDPARYGRVTDGILFYTKSAAHTWNVTYMDYSDEYIRSFRYEDERGKFQPITLTGPGVSMGESGGIWRNYSPTDAGRHWSVPRRVIDMLAGASAQTLSINRRLDLLDEHGYIYWPDGGVPRLKQYLHEMQGARAQDNWTDIRPISSRSKERVGYPTQKPLALLERIINASSHPGDMVLDPFCGCATTCVAAESLGRRWIGIDLSQMAVTLTNSRLKAAMGDLFHDRLVTARTDIPRRTDIDKPIPYRQNKHVLFGQQEGRCNGCRTEFPFRVFEVDHIIPRSRGGTDHLDNLQLLCAHCNRIKGDRPQEYLVARLSEMKIYPAE